MIVAIASKRAPKVNAVKTAFTLFGQMLGQKTGEATLLTYEIDGGISMPRTIGELLGGAKQRVDSLQQLLSSTNQHADYYIGLEGGFHSIQNNGSHIVFLQSWAYVSNGKKGYFGSSANVPVPDTIAHEVMKNKRELSEVIDEAVKMKNVRGNEGTWGVLTIGILNRQQSFEQALVTAFAPFYNKTFYGEI